MHDIQLTFTHQNVNFPGCDAAVGGDCSKYGIPGVENDVMDFHLSMDLDVAVTPVYVTYGVTDKLDISVVVPLVQADFRGSSNAQIQPFGGTTATHYFAGTPTNPMLSASRESLGSASGLGDVDVRAKVNLRQNATPTSPCSSTRASPPVERPTCSARGSSPDACSASSTRTSATSPRTSTPAICSTPASSRTTPCSAPSASIS